MKTELFNFKIPEELIAQYPIEKRSNSKLLIYKKNEDKIIDTYFYEITSYLDKDTLLVFNNSKVIPARIYIKKINTKREGELLVLKIIDPCHAIVLFDKAKLYKKNTKVVLPDESIIKVTEELTDGTKFVESDKGIFTLEYLKKFGNVPLPPYIRNKKTCSIDKDRYQTIYSKYYGSAAAPTAGFHFDEDVFKKIEEKGIETAFICLHVGLGTFQPIYKENIEEHQIHEEEYFIDEEDADKINKAIKEKKKIIAVGTTTLRTLESAYSIGGVKAGKGVTSLYIYPPYNFKIINGLVTNFHTPKSTLLVLVAALIGYEKLKQLYEYAIEKKYRFFSYGDAMLIL